MQPSIPYTRAPSASVGRFDFLNIEERRPAQLSYEFFSDIIATSRVMPSRVWFDLDDTLIRPRKIDGPIIFQGAIVGAMRAFSEGKVDVGIFSFWCGVAIWDLIDGHPFLQTMITHDEKGTPLIRGVEHINHVAMSLADPEQGVHAAFDERGFIYYDSQPELTDSKCRSMKIIRRDEMLIDNDDLNRAYLNIALHFAPTLQLWQSLSLARAIEASTRGYLHLDDPKEIPVPKFLSGAEMDRTIEIFKRLEWEQETASPSSSVG
jgi:hypothetical protein